MAMKQSTAYCQTCHRQTMHTKQGINHLLHFFLSISVVWLPVWLTLGIKSAMTKARCSRCGMKEGSGTVNPLPPEAAKPQADNGPSPAIASGAEREG